MPLSFPAVAASSGGGIAHLYNWNPASQLVNFRGGRAKVRQGLVGSRCVISCLGDSTTAGFDGTTTLFRAVTSWPARLAARLTALGVPAGINGFAGSGNYPVADSRIVNVGTGDWTGASAFGGPMKSATGAANGFNFTPGVAFNRIDVDYYDAGTNTFTIGVDGNAASTVTSTNTGVMKSVTLSLTGTASSVIHYLASANQTFIQGIRVWSTTAPAVEVVNGGCGGIDSNAFQSIASYSSLGGAVAIKPALTIVNLGINDANNGTSTAAAYQTNLNYITTQLQSVASDVILCLPTPINNATAQALISGGYYTGLKAVADANNVPVVSWVDRYRSYAVASSLFGQSDNLHPNAVIYDDEAAFLASILAAA